MPMKKVKTESKVNPWDVTDLTNDSEVPANKGGSPPTESFVDVLPSGGVVTKRIEKGKEVEVVELDDSDWVSYGEVSSTVVGMSYCQVPVTQKEKVLLGEQI
jgi:hypothetical protein